MADEHPKGDAKWWLGGGAEPLAGLAWLLVVGLSVPAGRSFLFPLAARFSSLDCWIVSGVARVNPNGAAVPWPAPFGAYESNSIPI
jgi:hypothetical protein